MLIPWETIPVGAVLCLIILTSLMTDFLYWCA